MPSHRPARPALARLRQMARMDLQGPQLVEPVLQTLHQLVGFDAGGYVYPGSDGVLQAHMEAPELNARVPDYFDPRILRSERELFHRSLSRFDEAVHHEHGPQMLEQLLKVPYAELLRSDFYNVVLRPAGVATWASLVLRTQQGQGIGTLILYRGTGSPPFRREELDTLAPVEASLAHMLKPGALPTGDREVQGSGLIIVTAKGRVQWISPEAGTLMQQAFGWRWRSSADALPATVRTLLRKLEPGQPGERPPPPRTDLCNAQGWFSLSATPMTAATGKRQVVALQVTRHVARGARLLSALRALDLPQRQHELAWWLARGLSEAQIAERMCISANTVVYHRRQLYNRLGVQDRRELMRRLDRG
ncbi:MAG: helix-turn-helix transcriptional regulator [Pseudomonadota bacterium]|nr:helix-turn-helix transcriptional regulator [Pseudomonadota bacterium]